MKNTLAYICFLLVILPFSSCVTGPDGYGEDGFEGDEYYSVSELLENWQEAVYDEDEEQFAGTYWPDAVKTIVFDGEEPVFLEGRDEIADNFIDTRDDIDIDDFDFPEPVIYAEGPESRVHYLYRDEHMRELLVITKHGELYGIQEHIIEPYFPPKVESALHKWADENGNGELEDPELMNLFEASHKMFFNEHSVENGFSAAFDMDGNGYISRDEIGLFREYMFGMILPQLYYSDPESGLEFADFDEDGRTDDNEIAMLQEYLATNRPSVIPERPDGDPVMRKMDRNGDGRVEDFENEDFYYGVIDQLTLYPHSPEPLSVFMKDGTVYGIESSKGVFKSGRERIEGKRTAVVGIDIATDEAEEEISESLAVFVENGLVHTRLVKVVDRKSIHAIIEEHNFQAHGLIDEDTAVEIGKLAGAQIIVTGVLSSVGHTYYLQLRLIDVETGEVLASSLTQSESEKEFLPMCTGAVEMLF